MVDKPVPPPPSKLDEIRAAYAQAKVCNLLVAVFAICGFLVFASIYEHRIAHDILGALRDISTIGIIVMVFLPAILLSRLAARYEKKYLELLGKE